MRDRKKPMSGSSQERLKNRMIGHIEGLLLQGEGICQVEGVLLRTRNFSTSIETVMAQSYHYTMPVYHKAQWHSSLSASLCRVAPGTAARKVCAASSTVQTSHWQRSAGLESGLSRAEGGWITTAPVSQIPAPVWTHLQQAPRSYVSKSWYGHARTK